MPKRLVIFAPNWLGDAVMALPAIASVRRGEPSATLTIAARPAIAPLFALVPGIDETIVIDGEQPPNAGRRAAWRATAREIASRSFDAALLLPNSIRVALIAAAAHIRERWGYRTQWRRALLTHSVAPPSGVHQVEYYRALAIALGFPGSNSEPHLSINEHSQRDGAALLMANGWAGGTPLVAMAPGAAYGGAKRWPPERFAELASSLAGDGVVTVLIGSRPDTPIAAQVRQASTTPGRIINLVGKTDLPGLAGVLAHCRTLVTNDSGAMHVGAAVGLPVTAVFGPTRDRETRPLGARHNVITVPVWCRPCMLRECPLDHRCMIGIDAATVLAAVRRTVCAPE